MKALEIAQNTDILISIIVPVYNVEQYVYDCLLSVMEQKIDGIEVIIIDDGSTDGSFHICKEIQEQFKDKAISIIQQENKGLSAARNTGMEAASGKYIMFLDSDDMLEQNAIEVLISYVKRYEIDLLLYDGINKNETKEEIDEMEFQRSHRVVSRAMSGTEYMADWYVQTHMFPVWLCLFRADYIKRKPFLFTEGKYHEDISFSFKTVLNAGKVMYIPESLYIRRCRPNSITTRKASIKNYDGILTALEECAKEYIEYSNKTKSLSNAISFFWCYEFEYVARIYKEWNGDRERAGQLLNTFLEELLIRDVSHRGYTWFSSVNKLLEIGKREGFEINDYIVEKIEAAAENVTGEAIYKRLEEKRNRQRLEIIRKFSLDNPSLKIGIYGIGNHSRVLIEEFQKFQKIQAKVYFIDSRAKSGTETFMGYDVLNYQDIPQDTDEVIISSFVHHGELLLACYNMQKKIPFQIVDPYEIECYPIDI